MKGVYQGNTSILHSLIRDLENKTNTMWSMTDTVGHKYGVNKYRK